VTNEDSARWETDIVTGVTWFSVDSWTALAARKSDGWHYLVHSSERAGGFIGASIQGQLDFQKREEAQFGGRKGTAAGVEVSRSADGLATFVRRA
jgi:hypothetical protein